MRQQQKPDNLELSQQFEAVIFDLDGVITDTAGVHAAAWKELFDTYLKRKAEETVEPFTPFDVKEDYAQYVDGKPRYDGIESFLQSRRISLPRGDATDSPDEETICGLANRKNQLFLQRLERNGIDVYDSTVDLVKQLRRRGIRVGVISSSKNCEPILRKLGLLDLFDVKIDGVDAEERGIPGKPAPDVFLEAARLLEVSPSHTVVVEDAPSGVQAGHAGAFGLTIGVDRHGEPQRLLDNGANIVVNDLSQVQLAPAITPPHALQHISELHKKLDGKQLVFFLDYDGTLTPIVDHPDNALLSTEMRSTIERLSERYPVAIVSGRDRPDVTEKVGLNSLYYAGSHGFDIAGPNGMTYHDELAEPFIQLIKEVAHYLRERLKDVEGALVEEKKFSVATHYRLVQQHEVPLVEEAVDAALAKHPNLRKTYGKKVYELQPNLAWDKGKAVQHLLEVLGFNHSNTLPIYVGDDITDEDAFQALRNRGVGIVVLDHPRETAAHFSLRDVQETQKLFEALLERSNDGA